MKQERMYPCNSKNQMEVGHKLMESDCKKSEKNIFGSTMNSNNPTEQTPGIGVKVDLRIDERHGIVQTAQGRFVIPGLFSQVEYKGWLKVKTSQTTRILLGILFLSVLGFLILLGKIHTLEIQNQVLETKMKYFYCRMDGSVPGELESSCDGIKKLSFPLFPTYPKINNADVKHEHDDVPDYNDDYEEENQILKNNKETDLKMDSHKINTSRFRRDENSKQNLNPLASNKTTTTTTKITPSRHFRRSMREARAAYLVVNAPEVNIQEKDQLIGPWFISQDGRELGFGNDLWYNNLELNTNATTIIFQESGIYLIYAQVYYHIVRGKNERESPVGYRISVKKNPETNPKIKKPVHIAECVPSHPETAYGTCFTQAAWFIGKGDEVYLEHHLPGQPMVESTDQGQTTMVETMAQGTTFLGIVRL